MINVFSAVTLPELECTVLLFGDACVIHIVVGQEAAATVLRIEGEGFSPRQIAVEAPAMNLASSTSLARPEILAGIVPRQKDTVALLIDGLTATTSELRLTLLRDNRAIARQNVAPSRLPAVMAAPRGAVITALTPAGSVGRVVVLADGKPLAAITAIGVHDAATIPQEHQFALPESLFDGKTHLFTLRSGDDPMEIQTIAWTCAPSHVRERKAKSLDWNHLANSFPPHEIDRVAAFLANKHVPRSDRAAPPPTLSRRPVRDALFVHSLTGAGAIAAATIANALEATGGQCCPLALLPSNEAVSYAAETGSGSALTQQVPTLTLSGLTERLAGLPRDGRAIFLPGGATLTAEGAALLRAPDGQVHVGVPVRSLARQSWQIDVHPHVSSPDLFDACAIIPCSALARTLDFGESRHDTAIVATCRVIGDSTVPIARTFSPPVTFDPRRGDYRLLIDAQHAEDSDAFESLLANVLSITPHCTVVGSRQLLLRLKDNPQTPGITGIISLGDPVLIDDPAICATVPGMPCLGFAADAIEALLSLPRSELALAVAFALHHTRQTSACRIFLSEDASELPAIGRLPSTAGLNPGPAQVHFTCTMPF